MQKRQPNNTASGRDILYLVQVFSKSSRGISPSIHNQQFVYMEIITYEHDCS